MKATRKSKRTPRRCKTVVHDLKAADLEVKEIELGKPALTQNHKIDAHQNPIVDAVVDYAPREATAAPAYFHWDAL
jgi:hypothetical protein